jgi:hypothetical protein
MSYGFIYQTNVQNGAQIRISLPVQVPLPWQMYDEKYREE